MLIGAKAGVRPDPVLRDDAVRVLSGGMETARRKYWAGLFGAGTDPGVIERARRIACSLDIRDVVRRRQGISQPTRSDGFRSILAKATRGHPGRSGRRTSSPGCRRDRIVSAWRTSCHRKRRSLHFARTAVEGLRHRSGRFGEGWRVSLTTRTGSHCCTQSSAGRSTTGRGRRT